MAIDAVLWNIRAKRSIAKCVLHVEPTWSELLVLQDKEITLREVFSDEGVARLRAGELKSALNQRGWREVS
jgi:hypothetical protein